MDPNLYILEKNLRNENLIHIKFQRIRHSWNSNLSALQRVFPEATRLKTFSTFVEQFSQYSHPVKTRRLRLEMNRLDFILQKTVKKTLDKRNLLSMFDQFAIYQIIFAKKEPKTGQVSDLLRKYIRRSPTTVTKQIYKMTELMNRESLQFLYEGVVLRDLQELAQELKMSPSLSRFDVLNERLNQVVRFSFVVDLFLICLFRDFGFREFLENWDILEGVRRFLKTKVPLGRVWTQGFETDDQFVKNFAMMFQRKKQYIDLILELEDLIIGTGFLDHFKTEGIMGSNNVEITSRESLEEDLSKVESSVLRITQKEVDHLKKQSLVDDSSHEQSKPESNSSCEKRRESLSLSKTKILEKRSSQQFTSRDPKQMKTTMFHPKEQQTFENKLQKMTPDNITFFDFGISYVKTRTNINSVNVEDFTFQDKQILLEIASILLKLRHTRSFAKYLLLTVESRPKSMKEFSRTLHIFYEVVSSTPKVQIFPRLTLGVINILYKTRQMIEYIKVNYFLQKETKFSRTKRLVDLN